MNKQEAVADIIAEMCGRPIPQHRRDQELLRYYADRLEAAWKREKSQYEKKVAELKKLIPQPDPDWKAICEKCHDGEIEPKCEYYGEPNGCNSPIYGEHPTAENSSAVGDAAHRREALKVIRRMVNEELEDLKDISDEVRADFISIRGWCDHALAEPPRNCDRVSSVKQAKALYRAEVRNVMIWDGDESERFEKWLLAPATKQKGENDEQK